MNENQYLEKSLIYNSVSIFALIDNVYYIQYNFSGKSYQTTRNQIEKYYPNYEDIIQDGIHENNFNQYLERKMNDEIFIDTIFNTIFHNESDNL